MTIFLRLLTVISLFVTLSTGQESFFQSKTVIIPHDEKRYRGGEDSADANDFVLTVADGVGDWRELGVDPGDFSRALTRSVIQQAEQHSELDTSHLLSQACNSAAQKHEGTSTLLVLKLIDYNQELRLEASNLGDSGYALFHVNPQNDTLEMYFRSPPQQKTHNFPYQCGASKGDDPAKAELFFHPDVREGDVVLAFTDGFHDNVFDSGMYHCIEEFTHGGLVTSLSGAADCLARKAYFLGKERNFQSPWMKDLKNFTESGIPTNSQLPRHFDFVGGKHDDITVTIAQIFASSEYRDLSANDTYFRA